MLIRSRTANTAAKENVRPAEAPVTVDTIVARREERACRLSDGSNYLDPNRPDAVRLSVSDARALGEGALGRIGYGGDDARIITDQLTDNSPAARLRGSVGLIVQRGVELFHTLRKAITMDRGEFEADLGREGYELREGEIKPNVHRGSHAHEFDARLFVLEGSITLVFGVDRCTYRPGDSCNVPAGTMHEEHTEADGVRYLAGRRPAAVTAAE
jgi:Cupin domain